MLTPPAFDSVRLSLVRSLQSFRHSREGAALQNVIAALGRGLWLVALLGAAWGGFEFTTTLMINSEVSAPQMAALAANSLVYAIVPYVFARAFQEMTKAREA